MSLVSYILSSILLSGLGAGIYLLFRRTGPSYGASRFVIWLTVVLSLALPLLPFYSGGAWPSANTGAVGGKAAPVTVSVHEFCHCSNPGAGDVIRYHSSRINDVVLAYRPTIWLVFAVILGAVLLRFSVGLGRLLWLTRKYAAEYMEVDGLRVRLVRGVPGVKAGALRLGGRYIFWQDVLDGLSAGERQAILLHELSHIRQYNTYERLVLGLVQAVWFLNPVYYFFRRELDRLSEFTADRYAAGRFGDAKGYARLLLRVKSDPGMMMVHLFKGGQLKARVAQVLQPAQQRRPRMGLALVICVALLLPSEVVAEQMIRTGIREIAVYEFLTAANHETGQEEFCKKCTYEAVEACY